MRNDNLVAALDLAFTHTDSDCLDCVFNLSDEIYIYLESWDQAEREMAEETAE